jgi:hypothetical protein
MVYAKFQLENLVIFVEKTKKSFLACLMLDHPTSGRHYACSQSQLSNGECTEKVTKSGAIVKVCSCDTSDYCNFKMWPSEIAETTPLNPQIGKKDQQKIVITRHNHLNSAVSSRYDSLFSIFVFQLLPIVFCIIYIR